MRLSGDETVGQVTRSACVCRFAKPLRSVGAPLELLLSEAGIPAEILEAPEAVIPIQRAFKLAELACHALGTEHLALHLGLEMSLKDFGPYGRLLQKSATVYEYLCKGIKLNSMLITGQQFWLSRHGREFRLNLTTAGEPGVGSYQSHVDSLAVTTAVLRTVVAPRWSPRKISFAWQPRENFPECEIFDGARIAHDAGVTYLTIPESMMAMRFDGNKLARQNTPGPNDRHELPNTLDHLVEHQISALISSCELSIDLVAESLCMNRRSLQRALQKQGLTYSMLLAGTRGRLAAHWLRETEKPVAEIGIALGYTDASNFTRAFRNKTGMSPSSYRRTSLENHLF